jgi:hypothetical protein
MNSRRTTAPQSADYEIPPLAPRPEFQQVDVPLREDEKEYAAREKQRQQLLARARGQSSKRSVAERAADLRAGGRIDPVSINDQLSAKEAELAVFRLSVGEKKAAVDQVVTKLSIPENLALRPQYDVAMRDGFEHMVAMLAAFRRAAALPAALVKAGYKPSSSIMPNIVPQAVAILGNVDDGWSQAWSFKRELEKMGII